MKRRINLAKLATRATIEGAAKQNANWETNIPWEDTPPSLKAFFRDQVRAIIRKTCEQP